MNIKKLPVIISFAITLILLFGGWHMYHSYALQSPLTERINSLDGVIRAEATVEPDTVHITLQLAPDASLRHIMQAIRSEGASHIKDRELVVRIDNQTAPLLKNGHMDVCRYCRSDGNEKLQCNSRHSGTKEKQI